MTSGAEARILISAWWHGWKPCPSTVAIKGSCLGVQCVADVVSVYAVLTSQWYDSVTLLLEVVVELLSQHSALSGLIVRGAAAPVVAT